MVKVIMNFEVEDWDKWHAAFLANSKMREENDIKEIYVGHELENKNKVHVIYDTPAPDTIQKMMQKPEVQEVMKNAGNKVETMVVATCTDKRAKILILLVALIGMADKEVVISIEKRVALIAIFIAIGMLLPFS